MVSISNIRASVALQIRLSKPSLESNWTCFKAKNNTLIIENIKFSETRHNFQSVTRFGRNSYRMNMNQLRLFAAFIIYNSHIPFILSKGRNLLLGQHIEAMMAHVLSIQTEFDQC